MKKLLLILFFVFFASPAYSEVYVSKYMPIDFETPFDVVKYESEKEIPNLHLIEEEAKKVLKLYPTLTAKIYVVHQKVYKQDVAICGIYSSKNIIIIPASSYLIKHPEYVKTVVWHEYGHEYWLENINKGDAEIYAGLFAKINIKR